MSVSRGEFLKALGKSLPGMVLNSTAATAAQQILSKMAAASGAVPTDPVAAIPSEPQTPDYRNKMVIRGPIQSNHVALTFDDGPHAGNTGRLLDELKKRDVRATFFMIGQNITAEPDLARRVLAEGHEIGNHTYAHSNLTTLVNHLAEEEIRVAGEIIASVLKLKPIWFRPPFGDLRSDQYAMVEKYGMRPVLGDVSTKDWSFPGEEHILAAIAQAQSGSIVICHDFCTQTAECLGRAIDDLLHRGLKPVTLSELLVSA
jgi:peptidoglycan/xylan/chitin deacetylase (PgdA/CDA1 family)